MPTLRVVFDTSILISYVLTTGDIMSQVVNYWREKEFDLLTSPQTREELRVVLEKPKIQKLTLVPISRLYTEISNPSIHVSGQLDLSGACRDPNNDMFLACAVEGRAHYLVSSDKDLLIMERYDSVCILNPGQFLIALQLAKLSSEQIRTRFSQNAMQTIRETVCLEPETAVKLTP